MEIKWIKDTKENFIFYGYIGSVKTSLQIEFYSGSNWAIYNVPINYINTDCISLNKYTGVITVLKEDKWQGTFAECKRKAYEFLKE